MEGPSLKIACEELRPFVGKKVLGVKGKSASEGLVLRGEVLRSARSWGKHLLLKFGSGARSRTLRIHFLMFGSYRIDDPRKNRFPKLELRFAGGTLYFYSCAIKPLEAPVGKTYDFTVDLMSPRWDGEAALKRLNLRENEQAADVLMDQSIFSGLGNIIKNEVLFRRRVHPETNIGALSTAARRALVKDAHAYSWLFYGWKKENRLKRNWKIFRKKTCPICDRKVAKRKTGKLQRVSHYCANCQPRARAR